MEKWAYLIIGMAIVSASNKEPSSQQLIKFKEKSRGPTGLLAISSGSPVEYQEATSSLNSDLLRHAFFIDSMTHLDRERIPRRFVHGRGNGAFGYFEVTHDITRICKAKLFSSVGKRTPIAVRFSETIGETSDTIRDIRGFAVKFYTEEGNFDIVGLNSPTFSIKDPLFFTSFVHSLKPNPAHNFDDNNMRWDFLTLRPESAIFLLTLFSDRGTPDGFRHIPGFSIHTYQIENEYGEPSFVRFHFVPDAGVKNLQSEEATRLAGEDPDYAGRDLYNAIANGEFPSWIVAIQIMSLNQVKRAKFDPFDITQVLPTNEFPLHQIGRFVLNKNPSNYFAEVEQIAMNPANLVPGILGAPDKLFEGRLLSYRDSQNYRLGANLNKITVNCPLTRPFTYNRDGRAPVNDNEKDAPNYFPNSFNGAAPYIEKSQTKLLQIIQTDSTDITQAREFYRYDLTEPERKTLPSNIVSSLRTVTKFIQERAIKFLYLIDPNLGKQVTRGINSNSTRLFSFDQL